MDIYSSCVLEVIKSLANVSYSESKNIVLMSVCFDLTG